MHEEIATIKKAFPGKNWATQFISVNELRVQRHPKRYNLYAELFEPGSENVLNMDYSPHCEFLRMYIKCKRAGVKFVWSVTRYYKMHDLYGKPHHLIVAKCSKFIKMFENINETKNMTLPVVIRKDDYYEIWDGHHRVACCIVLKMGKIACRVLGDEE